MIITDFLMIPSAFVVCVLVLYLRDKIGTGTKAYTFAAGCTVNVLLTLGLWLCYLRPDYRLASAGLSVFEAAVTASLPVMTWDMARRFGRIRAGEIAAIAQLALFCVFMVFQFAGYHSGVDTTAGEINIVIYSELAPFRMFLIYTALAGLATTVVTAYCAIVSRHRRNRVFSYFAVPYLLIYSAMLVARFQVPYLRFVLCFMNAFYLIALYFISYKYDMNLVSKSRAAYMVFRSVERPFLFLNIDGNVFQTSDSALKFFRKSRKNMNGINFRDLLEFNPDDLRKVKFPVINPEYGAGGSVRAAAVTASRIELPARSKTGGEMCMVQFIPEYDIFGEYICIMARIKDVTENHTLAERLRKEQQNALFANKAKIAFLSNASYELRSPLNTVYGLTELILLMPDLTPVCREYMQGIKTANETLLSVIDDVISYSQIESDKLKLESGEYTFSSVFSNVMSVMRNRLADKPILIIADIDPNIPNALYGDSLHIRHALLNMLTNALLRTAEGYIKIEAYYKKRDARRVELFFRVSDSGERIDPQHLSTMFSENLVPDGRGDIGKTRLGLSLAKRICELMGGDVEVQTDENGNSFVMRVIQYIDVAGVSIASVADTQSKKVLLCEAREIYAGSISKSLQMLDVEHICVSNAADAAAALKGGKFTDLFVSSYLYPNLKDEAEKTSVQLPEVCILTECGETTHAIDVQSIAMPANVMSVANVLNDKKSEKQFLSSNIDIPFTMPDVRVLLVDDVPTNLLITRGILAAFGAVIDISTSGARALSLLKLYDYDIIFMDQVMPDMDGVETTRRIRGFATDRHDISYYKQVPVIALTANTAMFSKKEYVESGMNDYMKKPIQISDLVTVLETWIPKEKRVSSITRNSARESEKMRGMFFIDGVDIIGGITRTGGTIETYKKVLRLFCAEGTEKAKEIIGCFAVHNYKKLGHLFHALKTSAKNIGANRLTELAVSLESSVVNSNFEYVETHYEDLIHELLTLIKNINRILENENPAENSEKALPALPDKSGESDLSDGEPDLPDSGFDGFDHFDSFETDAESETEYSPADSDDIGRLKTLAKDYVTQLRFSVMCEDADACESILRMVRSDKELINSLPGLALSLNMFDTALKSGKFDTANEILDTAENAL